MSIVEAARVLVAQVGGAKAQTADGGNEGSSSKGDEGEKTSNASTRLGIDASVQGRRQCRRKQRRRQHCRELRARVEGVAGVGVGDAQHRRSGEDSVEKLHAQGEGMRGEPLGHPRVAGVDVESVRVEYRRDREGEEDSHQRQERPHAHHAVEKEGVRGRRMSK